MRESLALPNSPRQRAENRAHNLIEQAWFNESANRGDDSADDIVWISGTNFGVYRTGDNIATIERNAGDKFTYFALPRGDAVKRLAELLLAE